MRRKQLKALNEDLLERSPKLIKECQKIRAEMKRGKYTTHEEVKKMFAKDLRNARTNGHK